MLSFCIAYTTNSYQAEESVQNSELNKCKCKLLYISPAALNLVFPPCSWGSSWWGSSCAILHIRPLQGGTYVRWRELCSSSGMCGALHRTGIRTEDHQQGQMQRQGKLQTASSQGNRARIPQLGRNIVAGHKCSISSNVIKWLLGTAVSSINTTAEHLKKTSKKCPT